MLAQPGMQASVISDSESSDRTSVSQALSEMAVHFDRSFINTMKPENE